MPLHDHFHPPLSERRPFESFHTTWASALADHLNHGGLPAGYIALEHIHSGAPVEIDVATYSEMTTPSSMIANGGTLTVPRTLWLPTVAPLALPAVFPPGCTVEIVSTEGGRTLVAAIEFVSPGNKDRASKRRLFVAKCATYLARGAGLVIVDVVTSRAANLHNEFVELILPQGPQMPADQPLYVSAYRPLRQEGTDLIHAWPMPVRVGEPLPTVPLSLGAELSVAVDLEAAYLDACQRRHIEEALG